MSLHDFHPEHYGPVLAPLMAGDRCRSLGTGVIDSGLAAQLRSLDLAQAFSHTRMVDRAAAQACLAGLWLLADDLDASHQVSQQIETREGSYWHGIMHRREGDFGNAKYWFRQSGPIAPLSPLGQVACEQAEAYTKLSACDPWNPAAFVDACQAARSADAAASACRSVQQREWELLFDHCFVLATGGTPT